MTHQDFNKMKNDLHLTNKDIAKITGLTYESVRNQTQPNRELPAWIKSMIWTWKRMKE